MTEDTTEIITFGCRLNTYESEVIRDALRQSGTAETIVFNTCAVTKEAERQARQAIRKAKKQFPAKKIIVTGCAAQINPEQFAEMPEVDKVIGNQEKLKAESYRSLDQSLLKEEKILVNDIMSVQETASHLINGFEGKSRAFVQVQNGCNHRCTFCIIPYGRGNSRSVPVGEIVQQIRHLVAGGYQEIVLTGVDISDYGKDLPGQPLLGQLVGRILKLIPELPRLRVSSIDIAEIDAALFKLFAEEPRVMPHVHVSLQAGDNMILKRMKRRHTREQVIEFCHQLRRLRPEIIFGADIIAGFPTETEEMFQNTVALIEEVNIPFLHVFPYSARQGTPAARMPQIPLALRKERAAKLRQLGEALTQDFMKQRLHSRAKVLFEKEDFGHTEQFLGVSVDKPMPIGTIALVELSQIQNHHFLGNIISHDA